MTGRDDALHGPRRPLVSRRRLLELAVALVPGLLGARLLARWLPDLIAGPAPDPTPATGAPPGIAGTPAADNANAHRWAMACDTTACLGCGRCVDACRSENGTPDEAECQRTWVERHVVADDGTVHVENAPEVEGRTAAFPTTPDIPGLAATEIRQAFFVPRLCMQCENPPCVAACPVSATYRTADGVTLVDQDRCIGCGYCLVACPYGARYIVPSGGDSPKGVAGVADKCTFCYHRISGGGVPACVEVCPVGARVFGDLNDPEAPVTRLLGTRRAQVMEASIGSRPRVVYIGLEAEEG